MKAVRRSVAVLGALAFAAIAAEVAIGASFFLFDSPRASAGDDVVVRQAGTPASFGPRNAVRPLQRPVRLYLVPSEIAPRIRSRNDPRLHFIGLFVHDRNGHGITTFTVPPLAAGKYAIASWCPGCPRFSRGRTFFVQSVSPSTTRYRNRMRLDVQAAPATAETCPATTPNGRVPRGVPKGTRTFHGNGVLAAAIPRDGVYVDRDGDGAVTDKMVWVARGTPATLAVRYERIDVAAAPITASTGRGTLAGFSGLSWASRMFYGDGCWKVTGRIGDVALSFEVEVQGAKPRA
jgi:hypothetical protein